MLYLEATPPAESGKRGHDATYAVVCRIVELFGELTDDELLDALERGTLVAFLRGRTRNYVTSWRQYENGLYPRHTNTDTGRR